MMTNSELRRMYAEFNRKWFSNRLPKDMIAEYARIEDHGITEYYRDRPLYILLEWDLRRSQCHSALTLLHEMCHVRHPKARHGPVFHKEMLRLAKAGAFKNWW